MWALLPAPGRGAVTTPAGVDTNPLNLDPVVRQAYQHFYILDYDGALSRFEKVQQENPFFRRHLTQGLKKEVPIVIVVILLQM